MWRCQKQNPFDELANFVVVIIVEFGRDESLQIGILAKRLLAEQIACHLFDNDITHTMANKDYWSNRVLRSRDISTWTILVTWSLKHYKLTLAKDLLAFKPLSSDRAKSSTLSIARVSSTSEGYPKLKILAPGSS